ncbi:MAG: penicillin-binding protein 1C [bacterium]
MLRQLTVKRIFLGAIASLGALLLMFVLLDRLFPPAYQDLQTSVIITDQEGYWLHGFTVKEDGQARWRLDVALEDIDPAFIERLILIEDKRFWSHPGVDALAVLRATGSMLRHRRITSGASTITMQTARLLEPRPRNIGSKFIEMLRAVQLEAHLSKQEILELYLTLAPYGGNLEGVRAASLAWFGKEPTHLTNAQQALLIALPQAPEARRPDRRPHIAKAARQEILEKLILAGVLSPDKAAEAQQSPVPERRRGFERLAWHLSWQARQGRTGGEYATTLSASLQKAVEDHLDQSAEKLKDKANIAALIIDNKSHEIRTLCGSSSLGVDGGWIDMTRAERSPGSTLKPFIYGLAFEDGLAVQDTLIKDVATSFGGYTPENFNRLFHGDVTVSEALQHSLNVPAVLALDKVGPQRFAATLQAAGIDTMLPNSSDKKASLAIALGGLGMTMRELGLLYSGLANEGVVIPLRWERETQEAEPKSYRLLNKYNTERITEILRNAPAPEGRAPALLTQEAPTIAFKTGTSYGYRDAWAAGYTQEFTIIVWVGHANGTPRTGVTGRKAALPILFDLFDLAQQYEGHGEVLLTEQRKNSFSDGGGLNRLGAHQQQAPEIIFPQDGVELRFTKMAQERGYTFTARGGAGELRWFVDGMPIIPDGIGGRPVWYPKEAGFYQITVVDHAGQKARARLALKSLE